MLDNMYRETIGENIMAGNASALLVVMTTREIVYLPSLHSRAQHWHRATQKHEGK